MEMIDLRADTCAGQSERMRALLPTLVCGDDVFGEDTHTRALEAHAASLCEKEAALFMPSGTMANLVALMAHARPGQEVIVGRTSHIFNYELGGAAVAGGLVYHPVDDQAGCMSAQDVAKAIRVEDLYHASSGLLCIENTHNLSGGLAWTPAQLAPVIEVARDRGLPVHLDGARILYACAALGFKPAEYARQVDTLMLCLTKGLGAPVGALLIGDAVFIEKARRLRKMLGGGMRQTGYLTAMGLMALQTCQDQLVEDVMNARALAHGLSRLPFIEVKPSPQTTNMVYFKCKAAGVNAQALVPSFAQEGILLLATPETFRFVCHNGLAERNIPRILSAVEKVLGHIAPLA